MFTRVAHIKRFDLVLVDLHHAYGAEMRKVRPCIVISPDSIHYLKTCIIAPLTSTHHDFTTRIRTHFHDLEGEVALDQMRAIDLNRIIAPLDHADAETQEQILSALQSLFSK